MLRPVSSLRSCSFWVECFLLPFVLAVSVSLVAGKALAAGGATDSVAVEAPEDGEGEAATRGDDPLVALPPAALEKLSAEQIMQIVQDHEKTRRRVADSGPDIVGILVPLGFFFALVLIILIAQVHRTRRERHKHDTLKAMVEKGAEIPPELLAPRQLPGSDLRKGAIWLGLGLGIMGFFGFLGIPDPEAPAGLWGMGLIPALVGAGYLLAWWLESRHTRSH